MNEKQRLFALAYIKLANGTKAAIEAGYSAKTAASAGSTLLRNPNVQALIDGGRIRREVHQEQTYQQLIAIANASMKIAQEALNDPGADRKEKVVVLEYARRAVATVGEVEGLMVKLPPLQDNGKLTLQQLAQKLRTNLAMATPEKIVEASATIEVREMVVVPDSQPKNGNGHAA